MGGGDDRGAPLDQRLERGLRQCRPLARLGPLPHLVQDHQRPRVGSVEDARQLGHAPREAGETRAQVLLVADVGEHRLERRHPTAGCTRHVHAGTDRERRQAKRLGEHGLPPRVGARDHEPPDVLR